ncbi:hypothetical protein F5B20DRAFT_452280 [Whalleya microplaca]|nr:hypothetical protein F5B20DRAFT_452280 [Whalleya microplaca]
MALELLTKQGVVWLSTLAAQWSKTSTKLRLGVSLLFAIGVLRKFNNSLSQAVANNFSKDSYDWRKEVVLVTGGSGGLGDLLVRKLAKQCIKVISLDIVPPKTPLPANAYFYQSEVTSSASLREVAQKIRSDHGDPTVLVNNAGIMHKNTILDTGEDEIRRIFDVNIIAHFLVVKEFLPAMVQRNHGHIVSIASMASFVAGVRNVDYACTKAGALAFHEGLAQELKHTYNAKKVRTSIIHPTYIRTPLLEELHKDGNFKARLLEPEAVADVILKHILAGNSGQVFIPGRYKPVALLRGLPWWYQNRVRNTQKDVLTIH